MAVRALPLAKALTARGHVVTLVLPPWSYPQDAGQVWEDEQVRIEHTTIRPRAMIPLRMLERVRALKPDIVHIFKPKAYAGLVQWMLWQLQRVGGTRTRIVLDTDDWEGAGGWNDLENYSGIQKRFFAWQENWGLRHADAVTVASRALESIVWSLGVPRNSVIYVPNGVNPLPPGVNTRSAIRQEFGLGDAPLILLYTRFFEFQTARLVEILTRVFERMPSAKLLVVGKGLFGEDTRFLELTAACGWRERVIQVGWVEPENLRAYFAAADVALFPFDDTLVNRCKCSVKLVDLLANGVPVVAEAVGQIQEYIRHDESGLLVSPGDVEGFASSVIGLLKDADERRRLSIGASSRMEQEFGWAGLAAHVETAYRQEYRARPKGS